MTRSLVLGLIWRIMWFFLPLVSEVALASNPNRPNNLFSNFSNDTLRTAASIYSDAILLVSCFVLLILGSTIGYFFPTPRYGAKPYPKPLKLLISVFGGVLAFVYYIHTEKNITPAVVIWVAGVSFVSPAIIHLFHAAAIKFTGSKLNVTDEDVDHIRQSFERDKE